MATIEALTAQLDELEARLPQMIEDNPDPADFWPAFAGEADVIEDGAGDHCALVNARISEMLAKHGRYLGAVDMDENTEQEEGTEAKGGSEPEPEMSENAESAGALLEIQIYFREALDNGNYDWDGLAAGVRSAKARGCATERDVADVDDKTLRPARMDEILTCLLNKAGDGRPGPKRERKDRP